MTLIGHRKGQIMRALLKFVREHSSKGQIIRALLKFVWEHSSKGQIIKALLKRFVCEH